MLTFSRQNSPFDRRIRRCATAAAAAVALGALSLEGGCSSGGGSVVQKAHVQRDAREPAARDRSEYRAFGQRLEEARLAVPAGFAGTVVVKFHEFPGRMILHINENSPGTLLEMRSPEGGGGQPLAGTISAGPVDRTITIEAAELPSPVQGQQQCELRIAASHPAPAAPQRIQSSFNLARVCKIGQPDGPTDSLPLADITFDLGTH
jgi:hypothetical protein